MHPCDGASAVRWRDPDLWRWPRFSGLRCLWAELRPGDVLRVPAYWMVHSELVGGGGGREEEEGGEGKESREREGCVTLILRSPAARARRDPGSLLLQAARQAETELSRVFSPLRTPQAMRDLLRVVKRGKQAEGMMKGSVFSSFSSSSEADAAAMREALAASLTDLRVASLGSARALLSALEAAADPRRFTRTPWLEADGGSGRVFPPALPWTTTVALKSSESGENGEENENNHRPRLFLDSRTAEEKKYPSLFRATIEAKAKERVPWIPRKKQLLILEAKKKKREKEQREELLLLEQAK